MPWRYRPPLPWPMISFSAMEFLVDMRLADGNLVEILGGSKDFFMTCCFSFFWGGGGGGGEVLSMFCFVILS